jgi:hypothetical protein
MDTSSFQRNEEICLLVKRNWFSILGLVDSTLFSRMRINKCFKVRKNSEDYENNRCVFFFSHIKLVIIMGFPNNTWTSNLNYSVDKKGVLIMKRYLEILILTVAILHINDRAFGFCGDTHAGLTQTAISNSVLSEYLQNQLGIEQGVGEVLALDQSAIPPSEQIPSDQFDDRTSSVVPSNPTIMDLLTVN